MKVFLSWSGNTSHRIAEKLHKWLPMVIQKVEPYISTEIEKGTRWGTDIAEELEKSSFGLACVTSENKDAPWLLFEAGALSKSVAEGKLAPLLFGLDQSDIQKSPLTQFQMTKFERDEFLRLLRSINDSIDGPLDAGILESLFNALWPDLEKEIDAILKSAAPAGSTANAVIDAGKIMGAMEELLTSTRALGQMVSRPEKLLPEDYIEHVIRRAGGVAERAGKLDLKRLSYMVRRSVDLLAEIQEPLDEEQKARFHDAVRRLREVQVILREGSRRTMRNDEYAARHRVVAVGEAKQSAWNVPKFDEDDPIPADA